jgi:tRNA threonylcarbamoyladenosine modification (KEOPS) complex  Pcc1 subunit
VGDLRGKRIASLRIEFPTEREAQIFCEALRPETGSPATPRSRVKIERKGASLMLHFEASDTTALRAALNSYLSWLHLLKSVCDTLDTES